MSGINRFLTRKDKGGEKKKVLPRPISYASSLVSEGLSSFHTRSVSGVTTPRSTFNSRHGSSGSLSSLSLALGGFSEKSAASAQLTNCLVEAQTANSYVGTLLQARVTSSDLHELFTPNDKKKLEKDEEKKIKLLQQKLARIGVTNLGEPQLEYALRTDFANGDTEKAYNLLVLFEDSIEGIIKDFDPNVRMIGAENRKGTTCYLDSLLFAMFARLGSFEAILYNSFTDEPRKRLATLLRLWVNMLRTGKLITTDVTKHIQESLAACGWEEAAECKQQDASEAFTFITEKLELPLLTLKMDIFHYGKEDGESDHRFVNERLLNLAVPADPGGGRPITLEDCLETYFNNRIDVRRYMERRTTMTSPKSPSFDKGSLEKELSVHIETVENSSTPSTPASSFSHSPIPISPIGRPRTQSIIQDRIIESEPSSADPPKYREGRLGRRASTRKEVDMPAWQFFSLIPWYTDNAPTNDAQVAAHFSSKRPVLGLCIKRYSMKPNGQAQRLATYIDIPLEIGLPHFIQDDKMAEDGPLFGNFKLSLQSVVCHRGLSVASGHYISLVRGEPTEAPQRRDVSIHDTAAESSDTASDLLPERWMRFDDMAKTRVSYVDIRAALKEELPYLLFYQVQPIDDDATPPPTAAEDLPPTYTASQANSRQHSISLDSTTDLPLPADALKPLPQSRPSLEVSDHTGTSTSNNDNNSESATLDPSSSSAMTSLKPETASTPRTSFDEPDGRPSRSASQRKHTKSRPNSQSGEGRLSSTLSRFAGRKVEESHVADARQTSGALATADRADQGMSRRGSLELSRELASKMKLKKREKSKTRRLTEEPDRQCNVM